MTLGMTYTGTGLQFTERAEGLRLKAYRDSGGVWTCGYGHTDGVGPSTSCTQALAESWLRQDTQWATNAVNNLVKIKLSQNEFNALVDFVFNIGIRAFSQSTMLQLLNEGRIKEAAEQFERWDLVKGKKIAGLLNRRKAEKKVFQTPDKGLK